LLLGRGRPTQEFLFAQVAMKASGGLNPINLPRGLIRSIGIMNEAICAPATIQPHVTIVSNFLAFSIH